jgi:hypothetical protein
MCGLLNFSPACDTLVHLRDVTGIASRFCLPSKAQKIINRSSCDETHMLNRLSIVYTGSLNFVQLEMKNTCEEEACVRHTRF